jgi:hypothetical protein
MVRVANPIEQLTAALSDRYTIRAGVGRQREGHVNLSRDLKHERDVAMEYFRRAIEADAGRA